MGSILFIARHASVCTLDTERHEWPEVSDYSAEITELVYQGHKYFFSLLDHESNFYLTVRVSFSDIPFSYYLMTAPNHPEFIRIDLLFSLRQKKFQKLCVPLSRIRT